MIDYVIIILLRLECVYTQTVHTRSNTITALWRCIYRITVLVCVCVAYGDVCGWKMDGISVSSWKRPMLISFDTYFDIYTYIIWYLWVLIVIHISTYININGKFILEFIYIYKNYTMNFWHMTNFVESVYLYITRMNSSLDTLHGNGSRPNERKKSESIFRVIIVLTWCGEDTHPNDEASDV